MTKLQLLMIGSGFVLLFVMYFGCETTPRNIQALEKSRSLATESTNLEVLLKEARPLLDGADLNNLMVLEQQLEQVEDDAARVELLKECSGAWFSLGFPAISGAYAEQAAEVEGSEESWAIAGTTFTICVQRSEEEKIRAFCTDHAVSAFENAISLNPSELSHKVNLALLYTENPPADGPMKGITMLLDLNKEFPESVLVLNSLGRLAIRTGQYDRAVERLEKANRLEPENANTCCLLAQAYEGLGLTEQANRFNDLCRLLTEKDKEILN